MSCGVVACDIVCYGACDICSTGILSSVAGVAILRYDRIVSLL